MGAIFDNGMVGAGAEGAGAGAKKNKPKQDLKEKLVRAFRCYPAINNSMSMLFQDWGDI